MPARGWTVVSQGFLACAGPPLTPHTQRVADQHKRHVSPRGSVKQRRGERQSVQRDKHENGGVDDQLSERQARDGPDSLRLTLSLEFVRMPSRLCNSVAKRLLPCWCSAHSLHRS